MGTGGSFLRSQDDDDILGTDLDRNSGGVIKRIPIEMKPRGKLGLRSVGSVGRKPTKGGSLRSDLSIDLENPEVERIRKDFEMYRLNKENEITNMQRKEQKYETENKRLRAELTVLQKTCNNMRQERDSAYQEKQQALARAAAFENDRDKVQRVFKIFRETKENEIQNLLRAKRDLENKLAKITHGSLPEDNDSASRSGLDSSLGNSTPGDWWTTLESDSTMGSTIHLHQVPTRGPELASTSMEFDGPFTNINKEDWSTALASLNQVVPIIPEQSLSCTIRIYISAPKDSEVEVETFIKDYKNELNNLCEEAGRSLVVVYLPFDDMDPHNTGTQVGCRKYQVDKATIFLAFLGDSTNRYTSIEFRAGHLDHPGERTAIFCFREIKGGKSHQEARELRNKIRDSGSAKIIDGYTNPCKGAEMAYQEIMKVLKIELGLDTKKSEEDEDFRIKQGDITDYQVEGVWDVYCNYEQMEAFNYAVKSSCELGFEKHYERLNAHVLSAGPLPPLLILSPAGAGRSLLLCRWIQLQVEKYPSSLVLYHLVGEESSISADPVVMIRRITSQLMQQVTSPPALTSDPVRLVEDFPRWLEKISSKTAGGVILVLDSLDRFHQAESHLKWLLDPLPVDARVIVSAHEDTCPPSWRSWPTLTVEPLSNKNVKELLRAELNALGATLNSEEETKVLTHCRNNPTCIPLYVMVLSMHIAYCSTSETKVSKHLDTLLTSTDCIGLYLKVIELLKNDLESQETRGLTRTILRYLYVSRNGLGENTLLDLISGLSWNFLGPFSQIMSDHLVLKYQGGLLMFAHEQVNRAVHEFCFGKDENKVITSLREDLVKYFTSKISAVNVSCRVTEELLWLLYQSGDKEALKGCLLNMSVFQKMYAKGRYRELLTYWSFIGVDKSNMTNAYILSTKQMEDSVSQYNGALTLPAIADIYETLGRFLKDLGQLNQALTALQRALEVRETALDPDHPIVAHSLHQLAGLHAHWNKFPTAEALYKQALDIYENALGSEHLLVAKELDSLAILYQKQDKHDLAEPLKKRAMLIRRAVKTPRTMTGDPMALITMSKPRIQGIDRLRKKTLQIEGLCMGTDSADLARSLNEIGVLHYLQNDFDNAESFFKRSLQMRENVLGPDHLDVSQSLNNLGALYNDRKAYSKAEPLYERALRIRMKHLNLDSPSVASVSKHLALLYRKQGKYEQAEPLYKQAVEIREKSFGLHHPAVATALVNLAVLYSQQNKYIDAEPLYERALRIYEESLGPHHSRVAETLRNLAVMKYELKDFETAARLYKRSTEIKESDSVYHGKDLSRRSSSGETNSTVKNLLHS